MPVPIFGLAKAVQMVAAGLERGESPTSILSRIVETGAVSTIEEGDEAFALGRVAFNAAAQLALGNTAGADAAIARLREMGAGDVVVTAKVQIVPAVPTPGAQPLTPPASEEEAIYRTVQLNLGRDATAQELIDAANAAADALLADDSIPGAAGGSTRGPILPYSVVVLP